MKSLRIPLILTISVLIAGAIAAVFVFKPGTPSAKKEIMLNEATMTDWPIFGGNQELNRSFEDDKFEFKILNFQPVLKWTCKCTVGVSAPVQKSGTAIVGCGDGTLRFMSLENGAVLGIVKLGDAPFEAPPMISGEMVYAGDTEGGFYCVGLKDFKLKWKMKLGNKTRGGANCFDSDSGAKIFIGAYDSRLYCLDALTGKEIAAFDAAGFVNGAPAVSQNMKMVFTSDCGGRLTVINAETLAVIKIFEFGTYIPASPAMKDGQVFFSAHDGMLHGIGIKDMAILKIQDKSDDSAKGKEKEPLMQSPAVSSKYVVSCGSKGTVKVFSASEKCFVAEKKLSGKLNSPLILGENVLVTGENGAITLLELPSLKEKWEIRTPYEYQDGAVFYGSGFLVSDLDGNVFCYSFKATGENSK